MRPTLPGMILTLTLALSLAAAPAPQAAWAQASAPAPSSSNPSTVNITAQAPAQVTVQVTVPPPVPAPAPVAREKPNPQPLADDAGLPNLQGFANAYQAAGEPRILVLVGIDSRPVAATIANLRLGAAGVAGSGAAPQQVDQAVGQFEKSFTPSGQSTIGRGLDGAFVGQHLSLFDPAGDALILKGTIEEWLHRVRDVDLVSLESLAERDRRELGLLGARDEKQAIDLLAQKVNADVALVVRMLNNGYVRDRGAMWRVSVETIQVARGRKIGGFAFEWTGAVDAYTIKRYAQEITRKFMDQFIGFHAAGPSNAVAQRYTLRLLGLADAADMARARQAFAHIAGMEKIGGGEFTAGPSGSVGTLTLSYAGAPLDLMVELQNAAGKALGMGITATDGSTGTITLVAVPGARRAAAVLPPPAPAASTDNAAAAPAAPTAAPAAAATPAAPAPALERPRWQLLIDPADPQARPVREAFLNEYKAQGSPKVIVLVGRALGESEQAQPAVASQIKAIVDARAAAAKAANPAAPAPPPGGVYVALAAPAAATAPADAPALLNPRRVEQQTAQILGSLGVNVLDAGGARERLLNGEYKGRDIFDADDLAAALGKAAGADIVVQGIARPDPRGPQGAVSHTFRAVRLADGVALAAEGWFTEPAPANPAGLDASFQNIAAFAAGRVADQMLVSWSAPRTLTVTVRNAKTQRDVFTLMSALKSALGVVESVDFIKHDAADGGTGSFSLRYRGTYESLIKQLGEQEKALPVSFTPAPGPSARDTLTATIKDKI